MTQELHSVIVRQISYASATRLQLFRDLPLTRQAEIFLNLSRYVQKKIVSELAQDEVLTLLENLDPDEATDALQLFSPKKQQELLKLLSESLQKSVSVLLQFDPKTAAGLMNVDYIRVSPTENMEFVIDRLAKYEEKTGKIPTVLVSAEGMFIGHVPTRKLVLAKSKALVSDYVVKLPSIKHSAKYAEVISLLRQSTSQKIVVLTQENNILGVIYAHDVLALLNEHRTLSLSKFAGVNAEETVFDSIAVKTKFRYKWLIINLMTAFFAASVVSMFESIIAKNVLLAVYMPIVAGMGGNAGTQTLAVMVRGLSSGGFDTTVLWRALRSEVGAAVVNGLINGALIAVVVMLLNNDPIVAFTLAFAMIVNLVVAATFGTIVPFIMKYLGKDPASSATIFITTATDVFGFLAFLGLAALLLS